MSFLKRMVVGTAGLLLAATAFAGAERDLFEDAPWYFGVGPGYIHFEGNEPVNPGGYVALRLGYDYS